MNSHHQTSSQVPPAVPTHNGRPVHVPYAPSPPFHQPPPYQGYAYPYPIHYARPPQQWAPYHMPMQMGRGYQQYPQMTTYPMPQTYQAMRPPMQHLPSSSSIPSSHSPHAVHSPPPLEQPFPHPALKHPTAQKPNLTSATPPLPAVPTSAATAFPPAAPPLSSPAVAETSPLPLTPTILPAGSASPQRTSFYPPLPWQSFEGDFPARRARRKRRPAPQSSSVPVELPARDDNTVEPGVKARVGASEERRTIEDSSTGASALGASVNTDSSSDLQQTKPPSKPDSEPVHDSSSKSDAPNRPTTSVLPIIPAIPNFSTHARSTKHGSQSAAQDSNKSTPTSNADALAKSLEVSSQVKSEENSGSSASKAAENAPAAKPAPKSWADLVRAQAPVNTKEDSPADSTSTPYTNGLGAKATSLVEALTSYSVKGNKEAAKIPFLEPRGLINTGNMCYMNSILQVLLFCVPFYTFLDSIGRRAAHSFKSGTPMLDAMIMFLREFTVIDAATSVDQLRMRLKDTELEQYGDAFIPEYVYDVIRRLPRFSSMRRGHQQDAEEFLGFLLEEMHDECSRSMKQGMNNDLSGASTPATGLMSPTSESTDSLHTEDSGWLEVGPKQRAAITRSSGSITTESPVTKIFGGKLRSELRVPGTKSSVTLEPYQPLQLDIGASHVSNIIDALKGLTKPETLHGDFNSPRGPGSTATKHVTIETLPQVLILHLKRFQYDNAGGTQKIWKKVGYPLDLEIPKEVFPQHKRGGMLAHGGLPKYRLISVVYHHGKNASGGHYTVDVRRQEEREWIRLDDTVIKRIRSEDVAEGGSEEDPKVLAAALERHKDGQSAGKPNNLFEQIAAQDDDQANEEKPWNQVKGSTVASANKKWANIANGVHTPKSQSGDMTPVGRSSMKDNKVAYILFYQRVDV